MNIFHKVTLKSLAVNKTRTVVTIIGIILSVSMITAVTTFISSLQRYMLNNAIHVDGDWHGAFFNIEKNAADSLGSDTEIQSAALAENIGYALIGSSNEYKPYLFIMGADDLFLERMPIHLESGRLPASSDEIILPEHLAGNGSVLHKEGDVIRLEIGDRYFKDSKLMQNNPYVHPDDADQVTKGEELVIREAREYTVVGFFKRPNFEDYSAPGYAAITKMNINSSSISFAAYYKMNKPGKTFDYLCRSGFGGTTNRDVLMYSGVSEYDNFYSVLYSLGAILMGLIMFGSVSLIYNAFSISVSERTRQFGLLASIGATRRQSRKAVLFEAMAVSSIGIPAGILSGILGIGVTLKFVGDKFNDALYGTEGLSLDLHVSPGSIIAACIVAIITVLISAWIPSIRATRVTAIDAIRLSSDINDKSSNVKTSRLTYKLFGLEGMIAKKHFKRSKKKYRATVVSLFMSIVLFISASSFCAYLTDAVTSTFQDSDYDIVYYYTSGNREDMTWENLNALSNGLLSSAGSITSLSYAVTKSSAGSIPVELLSEDYKEYYNPYEETGEVEMNVSIYGVGDEIYRQYLRENSLDEKTYMDRENPRGLGQAVMSMFDTTLQKHISIPILNDTSAAFDFEEFDHKRWSELTSEEQQKLRESGGDDEYRTQKLLNIDVTEADLVQGLNEYYNSGIKTMYPMSIFMEMFDANTCNFYIQSENPDLAYTEIKDYLKENDLPREEYALVNVYEMNETDRNMVTIIKVFSYGFIVLISLIALANVFNTISTNIMLRRREFAMLKSVGMTNKGFKKMMNFECILYGFKSLVWGIPAAFGVTWLIYRSVERGYQTAFYLPWTSVLIAICSVFAVVFATMVYSMRKINGENPIDALRNDNL